MNKTIMWRCIVFLLAISVVLSSYVIYYLNSPLAITADNVLIDVVPGDNISKIANRLNKDSILKYPRLFILITYVSGQASTIQAGEYSLEKTITAKQLLKKLTSGDVVKRQVTFLEGWAFKQMLQELEHHSIIASTLQGLPEKEIAQKLNIDNGYLEGNFFPDSYRYQKGTTDFDVLNRAHERMKTILQTEWQQRDSDLPYKTPYEALIMASIIEKETGTSSERSRIASVFVNRLKLGMPLQTDPSVIYGLGETYKGNLTRTHLQQDTPYNTYTRAGLPPTPIANPSREAIHAALHPALDKALYFVGKGDGTHYFSENLSEHNKAVRQYQLNRNNDNYRSSPGR